MNDIIYGLMVILTIAFTVWLGFWVFDDGDDLD